MSRQRWCLLVAASLLAGCAPQAPDAPNTPSAETSRAAAPSPSATPTPSPTPTPMVDPTERKPGTNHSYGAETYVYSSAEVHDWMHGRKQDSPTYPTGKKIAFLTFDDGPSNTTPKVLAELKRLGVPASFFLIGRSGIARSEPAILEQMIQEGHSVCTHSWSHSFKQLYPGRRANAEVIAADYDKLLAGMRDILGDDLTVHCHRYPGGHAWKGLDASDAVLTQRQASWLDWNSENGDGRDSAPNDGEGRARIALSTLGDKPNVVVVLMHDYRDNQPTVDSIAPVVEQLKADGYEFGILD